MDVTQTNRSSAPIIAPEQPQPKQKQQNVQTELPKPVSVQSPEKISQIRSQEKKNENISEIKQVSIEEENVSSIDNRAETRVEIDPETESLIFKAVNSASGEVINQFPAESILKLRAYVQQGAISKESALETASPPPSSEILQSGISKEA